MTREAGVMLGEASGRTPACGPASLSLTSLQFKQEYEWIDHIHAKFEDEHKFLQGENDDIIGSGALFTSICNPNQLDPDFSLFFVSPCRNFYSS